jgi:subtilisin family serine protease
VDPPLPAGAQDEIVVRYRVGTTAAERGALVRDLDLSVVRSSRSGRTAVVKGKGVSAATVRRLLQADPRVAAIGQNQRRELAADPDAAAEELFRNEWALRNTGQTINGTDLVTGVADVDIDGLEALRVQRGKPEVIVAVIDDGVDLSHPDLVDRAWTNPGETPGNRVDDDDNGFVDDVHGWDFCHDDDSLHDPNKDGHGTHVAGTIAAALDGKGVVGVAPGIRIMAIKFLEAQNDSCGTDAQAIDAIDYAASFGVPIINASWGGTGKNAALDQAIAESGALFVAASGNGGGDLDRPGVDFYPAESNAPNILAVGAIDQTGNLTKFTNYGATAVDLVAPGANILSTWPQMSGPNGCSAPCYAWSDGTSMAAPHVTGVAALASSAATSPMSPAALRAHVLARAYPLAAASCFSASGRIVNAYRAVTSAGPTAMAPCTWRFNVGSMIGTGISSTLTWQPASGNLTGVKYVVLRRRGSSPWSTIATQTGRSIRQTLGFGTSYRFATRTRTSSGSLGPIAYAQYVSARLLQENTTSARYSGRWLTATSSTYSGGKTRMSTQPGAYVEFRRSARAIALIGRRGRTSGKAQIYVDGALAATIDLYRSTTRARTVLFSRSWTTIATHTVRVVVVGTPGRPRVDIDGFAFLR